jgi:hypothetical protein
LNGKREYKAAERAVDLFLVGAPLTIRSYEHEDSPSVQSRQPSCKLELTSLVKVMQELQYNSIIFVDADNYIHKVPMLIELTKKCLYYRLYSQVLSREDTSIYAPRSRWVKRLT